MKNTCKTCNIFKAMLLSVVVLLMCFSSVANAAVKTRCYPMQSTFVYTDDSLKRTKAFISRTTEITVLGGNTRYLKILYNNKTGYIPTYTTFSKLSGYTRRARWAITVYKWKNSSSTYGKIFAGDYVRVLEYDYRYNRLHVQYPVAEGYKAGWIRNDIYYWSN